MVCFNAHLHIAVFAVTNTVFFSHSLYYVCKLDVLKPLQYIIYFCNSQIQEHILTLYCFIPQGDRCIWPL